MITSPVGLELITHFEGKLLTAYKCPAGIWTIGVGHTGSDVKPGMTITEDECTRLLMRDLSHCEVAVASFVTRQMQQCQFDALVSFTFNLGQGSLRKSTLLKMLNLGHVDEAADEFLKWNKAGGVELPGLIHRRAAERQMFLGQEWT